MAREIQTGWCKFGARENIPERFALVPISAVVNKTRGQVISFSIRIYYTLIVDP